MAIPQGRMGPPVCSELNVSSGNQCGCKSRFRFVYVDPETKVVLGDREHDDDFCCGRHYSKKARTLEIMDSSYFVTEFQSNNVSPMETLYAISTQRAHPNLHTAKRLINGHFATQNGNARWIQVKQIIQLTMLNQLDRIVQPTAARPPMVYPPVARPPVVQPPAVRPPAVRPPAVVQPAAARPPAAQINPQELRARNDMRRHRDTAMSRRADAAVVVLPPPTPSPPPPPPPEEPPPPPPVLEDPSLPLREGETRDCSVCMTNEGTVRCSENRHVMCEGCFGDYAVTESSNPSFDGELRCCSAKAFGCKAAPFSSLSVLRRLPEDKAQAFMRGLRNSQERSNFDEFERNKIADEQRRRALDEVEKACAHVVENILTLRCPRPECGQAFVDFDGCMALTCSRCKAGICGKCFMQFGNDAHSHITRGECSMDPSQLIFANQSYIRNVQRVYRTNKLNAYLRTLRPETASEVFRRCDKELRDLEINITSQ